MYTCAYMRLTSYDACAQVFRHVSRRCDGSNAHRENSRSKMFCQIMGEADRQRRKEKRKRKKEKKKKKTKKKKKKKKGNICK